MTQTAAAVDATDLVHLELGVTGMTCTSCSSRIERKINKVEGADAIVNYATETATIDYDPSKITEDELIEVVRGAGYDAFTMTAAEESATVDRSPSSHGIGWPISASMAPRERVSSGPTRV